MPLETQKEKELALRALDERKREALKQERVDNASLPVGSPMYYYCKFCRLLTDVLPESHVGPPQKYCDECQKLKDAGWDGKENAGKNHRFY